MSRSVSSARRMGSRMPYGTFQSFLQNVGCCIVVSIKHDTTTMTDVGSDTERFLYACSTCRTILARVVGGNTNNGYLVNASIGFHPLEESSPSGIVDTLG